jgi:folate-binding protein YgfZ
VAISATPDYPALVNALSLHDFHASRGAQFAELGGWEMIASYGDVAAEYRALRERVGVLDLSFRSRLCLTGQDRQRFLNGQVTNNVKGLEPGQGCYAALVTAKGKLQSDLNIYCLPDELLLDFEPGLGAAVAERFASFIIADDVQVVDVAGLYGLLSVQGPGAAEIVKRLLGTETPSAPLSFVQVTAPAHGELYCMNQPRGPMAGFDVFAPNESISRISATLTNAAEEAGGRLCGWEALEMTRIEAGIPRFGMDMDETNLAPEAGLDRGISYTKGCYIGQEIIARIRTYGQVAKSLRGFWLPERLAELPKRGEKLYQAGREVGYITSALASPAYRRNIALGYVRRECPAGTTLELQTPSGAGPVEVIALPFPPPAG